MARRKKGRGRRYSYYTRRSALGSAFKRVEPYIAVAVLIASIIVGAYYRLFPVYNAYDLGYKPMLFEMDPYQEYWVANQIYTHDPGYFWELRRFNPVTHIFWYPWGRDFTLSSLPALPYFAVLTYDIAKAFSPSLTLFEWMVYLPAVFFALTAIGIFLTARELWGDLPAAFASMAAALLFVSRHVAGFTVKYSIGLGFIFIAAWLHVRAWKKKDPLLAVLAGIAIGVTATAWAGYNLLLAAVLAHVILIPILKKDEWRDAATLWVLEAIPITALIVATPFYKGISYIYRSVGIVIPVGIALVALFGLYTKVFPKLRLPRLIKDPRVPYICTIALIILGGYFAILTGFIRAAGKAFAAIGLGSLAHVLVSTVEEYRSATGAEMMSAMGALLVASVLMLLYMGYKAIIKRETSYVFIASLFIFAIIATSNIAYFISFMEYVTALTAASFFYLFYKQVKERGLGKDWFLSMLSAFILVAYVTAVVAQGASTWLPSYTAIVPQILNSYSGIAADAPAWYDALQWIKENTPSDAVVVAWWDYGYWISVVGERASVADGATLNTTQIEWLALALMSNETRAIDIFADKFLIPNDKLYVVVYEYFAVNDYARTFSPGPLLLLSGAGRPYFRGGDAAKAIAAISKIAAVLDPEAGKLPLKNTTYVMPNYSGSIPNIMLPDWSNENLTNKLLFKLILDAGYRIWGDAGYRASFQRMSPFAQPEIINNRPELQHFKPVYLAYSLVGTDAMAGRVYVVVAVYQYTLLPPD